ncbi:hypothetical protein KKE48_00230 [Patescibacteria group bacterium]|nr:hypothetical protein [Patescibacteria group bacterium]MBU1499282.1 hypothetical protein [Patescibacteria group bacterium]
MAGEDVIKERTGVDVKFIESKLGSDEKAHVALGTQSLRRGKEAETRRQAVADKPEVYIDPQSAVPADAQIGFESFERMLGVMRQKIELGEPISKDELKNALDQLASTPGGGREKKWELERITVNLIKETNGVEKDSEKTWNDLIAHPGNIETIRKEHPRLVLVYEYFEYHDANPKKIVWQDVLDYGEALESVIRKTRVDQNVLERLSKRATKPDEAYQRLLAREGYSGATPKTKVEKWTSQKDRLKAYENILGVAAVDPMMFWKRKLLTVLEERLAASRSCAVARWTGKELKVTRPLDHLQRSKEHGYAPALLPQDVTKGSLLGNFLGEMGRREYWRGKAMLDYSYWSIFMGQLFEHPQGQEIEGDIDITADLSKEYTVRSKLRNFTGMHAIDMMRQDPLFLEALNELYLLPWEANEVSLEKGNDFQLRMQNRLERLGVRHGFDPNKDLPQFVTDAVMLSTAMALDAQHLGSADRRYRVYFLAEYYNNAAISLLPKQAKFWKPIIELLGFNFRFTESPLMKMGYIDSLNLAFNYHAFVPDDREFNPAKYPDQIDKVWQYMYMFCLELRENQMTRREVDEDNRPLADKSYTSLAGQVDAYTDYDNNRWIQREGQEKIYDHRRGVYNRLKKMSDEDQALLTQGEGGKTGWDKQLRTNLNAVLAFLSKPQKLDILGVQIQTNGEEIFYNDQLAELLNDYESNRNDPKFANDKNYLEAFLAMRNVLRDARAWGLVWGLGEGRGKENEALDRLEAKKDLELVHMYDVVGDEDRSKLLKIINVAPFVTPGEMPVTPATVLETIKEFGHRYKATQFYPTMFKLYEFANLSLVMRMSQLEIPDIRTLAQAVDPSGDIRFGAWGEKFIQALGPEWHQAYLLQKQLGQLSQELGFLDKLTLLEVALAERGFYEMYDNALEIEVLRLVIAEALTWQHQRDFPLKQRGGIQRKVARYRDEYQPVESFQAPDITFEKREKGAPLIISHALSMEDLIPYEIKTFFKIVETYDEVGLYFGGIREALLSNTGGAVMLEDAHEKSVAIKDDSGTKRIVLDNTPLAIFQETEDHEWYLVGTKKDVDGKWQKEGWIKCDRQNLQIQDQKGSLHQSQLRQGEFMLDGGRVYFDADEEIWRWEKGFWDLPARNKSGQIVAKRDDKKAEIISNINVFFPDEERGFNRLRRLRISDGTERITHDDIGWIEDPKEHHFIIESQINKIGGKAEEVIEPFVVFDGLEKRLQFLLWRKRITYSALFGYSRESLPGGQAMVELGFGFKDSTAQFTDIFRWAGFVLGQMRKVKRIGAYKQILMMVAKDEFGLEIFTENEKRAGGILEQRMVPTQEGIKQEIFPEDIELVEKYRKSLGFWGIIFEKRGKFWSGKGRAAELTSEFWTKIANKGLVTTYKFLNWNIDFNGKSPIKLNIPVNVAYIALIANAVKAAAWKLPAFFAAVTGAPWQFLLGYGSSYFVFNALVPYLGTRLANKIYSKARVEVNKIGEYENEIEKDLSKFKPAI